MSAGSIYPASRDLESQAHLSPSSSSSSSSWGHHTVDIRDEEARFILDFMDFLKQSPTAVNAVAETKKRFVEAGYTELLEKNAWALENGKSYFVTRNDSSIVAFTTPTEKPVEARIIGAHTDSPGLKLKPIPDSTVKNYLMLSPEIYGGPTISTFLNRPLGLAGKIIVKTSAGEVKTHLININEPIATIPPVAIHLERGQGETLTINPQKHLPAIAAVNCILPEGMNALDYILKKYADIDYKVILGSELFLTPIDEPKLIGIDKSMILSPRLDDLLGSYTTIQALIEQTRPLTHRLRVIALWDHEEIGSTSSHGAHSSFLGDVLNRITDLFKLTVEEKAIFFTNSYLVSNDVAHALHPNYADLHEPAHQPLMGKGTVIKFNSQQKYATGADSEAMLRDIAARSDLKLQSFVVRSDKPCGSTIGPLVAALLGLKTVDIGAPILSMHSAVELTSVSDCKDIYKLLYHVLQD